MHSRRNFTVGVRGRACYRFTWPASITAVVETAPNRRLEGEISQRRSGLIGAAIRAESLRQSTPGTSTYNSISLPSGSAM